MTNKEYDKLSVEISKTGNLTTEDIENIQNYFMPVSGEKSISSAAIGAIDLALLNAEQRYLKTLEQQADFIQNIPLQYIASYLGIKPQSLSRIRKKVIK